MTKVAILIENNFEDSEFQVPNQALTEAGAEVVILGSRMNDEYEGKRGNISLKPDATATEVRAEDFDAIVIPGGAAPDRIRTNPHAVRLVMNAIALGKIVAAVCHGPQVLIEADQLRDKRATGYKAIRKDIQNAGATYINEPVVTDGNILTSRQPGDLPLFTATILKRLGLNLENAELPEISDETYEWWRLGEIWGGSQRDEIVNALHTAISGESYTAKTFDEYSKKAIDSELKLVLIEICTAKKDNIQILQNRLAAFNETNSWQEMAVDALANFQTWLQSNQDDMAIMRRALGDLQTGVVDCNNLCSQITDPASVKVLTQVANSLMSFEERLSDLYRARAGKDVQPPTPTTIPAVG